MIRHAHRVPDIFGDEREKSLLRRFRIGQIESIHFQVGVSMTIDEGEEGLTLLSVTDVDHALGKEPLEQTNSGSR